jgi:hypothetical protein
LVLDAPERVGRADVARRSRCDLAGPARRGRPTPASPCALGPSRAATYACSKQQFQNERAKDRNTRSFNLKQETTEGSEEETRDCDALKNLKHELVPFSPSSLKITVGLERQRQLMIRPDFGGGGGRGGWRTEESKSSMCCTQVKCAWEIPLFIAGPARPGGQSSSIIVSKIIPALFL